VSHIYDALRKAGGDEPRKPGETPAAGGERRGGLAPRGRLTGRLLGDAGFELMKEVDGLRHGIEGAVGPAPRRVVGLAGAVLGDGATTLAVHLAHLLARVVQYRVLLIDGDMARSNAGLSQVVSDRPGLSELLRQQVAVEDAILATEEGGLHFLPAGRDPIRHVEAAASASLRPLLDQLGNAYDWVVIDLPPVLRHPETRTIAAACTGVVLVIRAHRTARAIAQRAAGELNLARCRVLGCALNARRESLPRFLLERV
jgi:capsular exopolysaccharide synthesis family protein